MQLQNKSAHKENSKDWWNERYTASGDRYLYSKEPSAFLLDHLDLFPKNANVLEIASGEGRNAVALASKGCTVTAIDFSQTAVQKAEKLASESGVKITFKTSDLDFFLPELLTYDVIVSVDFKPPVSLLKNLSRGLKQNGILLMEALLMESAKTYENVETFECYKPNELLHQIFPSQASFQVLHYSELGKTKWGEKAFLIAKKAQLF